MKPTKSAKNVQGSPFQTALDEALKKRQSLGDSQRKNWARGVRKQNDKSNGSSNSPPPG